MNLMEQYRDKARLSMIVLLCLLHIGFGLYAGQVPLMGCGATGIVYVAATTMGLCNSVKPMEARRP